MYSFNNQVIQAIRYFHLMSCHVSPYTTRSGEYHSTLSTLKHSAAVVCSQMSIETSSRQELLIALKTDERSFSRVASRVLFEMGALLEDSRAIVALVRSVQNVAPAQKSAYYTGGGITM